MRIYTWLFILCLFAVTACPRATDAHSAVERTFPAADVILDQSPETIDIWYEDYVEIHQDSITIGTNTEADIHLEPAVFDPKDRKHVVARLAKPLPSGTYYVSANVISIDSHPVSAHFQAEQLKEELAAAAGQS